jgi:hypothetical protein
MLEAFEELVGLEDLEIYLCSKDSRILGRIEI